MELIKLEDITPELLDRIEWEQTELKFANCIREKVEAQGREYREQLSLTNELEVRCQMKALWLRANSGYTKQEIRELFGVDLKTINRWFRTDQKSIAQ
jgi:hypothetical protein